jgi:hypothetical protein
VSNPKGRFPKLEDYSCKILGCTAQARRGPLRLCLRHYKAAYKRNAYRTSETVRKRQRANLMWAYYRLTPEEYEIVLKFQGGVCAIAKTPPKSRRLAIDHSHKTGELRGLLSPTINKGLAYFNHDPVLLRAAADYLENPPLPQALGKRVFGVLGKARWKKKMIYGSLENTTNAK